MSETLHNSESSDGTGDQTGPGILTVKLGWAYGLRLPVPDPTMCERWRPYAIGEYEGLQLSTEAMAVYAAKGAVSWAAGHRPFEFEVSASPASELTVSLFVRDSGSDASSSSSSAGEYENQCIPLGLIRLNPFLISPGRQKVDVQDGTGRVEVEVSYTQKEVPPLETREVWSVRREHGAGDPDLIYVEKKDTGRSYGLRAVDIRTAHAGVAESDADTDVVNIAPSLSFRSAIQHPFIAPLKFAFRSSEGILDLLSHWPAADTFLTICKESGSLMSTRQDFMRRSWSAYWNTCMKTSISFSIPWSQRIFSWIPLAMSVYASLAFSHWNWGMEIIFCPAHPSIRPRRLFWTTERLPGQWIGGLWELFSMKC